MNKSIMYPEFMSGALRSHKLTKFSRGAYSDPPPPPPPAALMARCARQWVHSRKSRTPPQRDQPTALCVHSGMVYAWVRR